MTKKMAVAGRKLLEQGQMEVGFDPEMIHHQVATGLVKRGFATIELVNEDDENGRKICKPTEALDQVLGVDYDTQVEP